VREAVRDVTRLDGVEPHVAHVLSNGRYATLLTPAGGGYSALDGFALTRWVPDPTCDAAGLLLYIRDPDTGSFRTLGGGRAAAAGGTSRFHDGVAEFTTESDGFEARLTVHVDAVHDAEVRRVSLRNTTDRPRTLELTTYAELSLTTPAADAAHQAFSKLFVQTAHVEERAALLAWRRPRSPDDRPLWVAHTLLPDGRGFGDSVVSWETDRMRFIGRGRDTRDPHAMYCGLTGTTGNVLDPVFSMRRIVRLGPGQTASFTAVLAAGASRDIALLTLAELTRAALGEHETATTPAPATREGIAALGLPLPWREQIDLRIGAAHEYDLPPAPREKAGPTENGARTEMSDSTGNGAHSEYPGSTGSGPHTDLQFFNGWGGFSQEGDEYVIRMPIVGGLPRRPPLPWSNVIANDQAGCIVTESGATYTWAANSRENRITPWYNDPVSDPHGEALYVRDDANGRFWSPTPGPAPDAGSYEARHGFGITEFRHEGDDITTTTAIFVPVDDPVRIARVEVRSTGSEPRRLTLFSYAQLVLGTHEADTRGAVETWSTEEDTVCARNRARGEYSERVAFATVAAPAGPRAWTTDRAEFLGRGGVAVPAGVSAAALAQRSGIGLDPCFALSCGIVVTPGETATVAFILGEAADESAALAVAERFRGIAEVDAALADARAAWRERLDTVRISTPSRALDLMVNGWLTYQNLGCRMWARSAYYQSGGAFGFRDQLQDSSALLHVDPAITRRQILLHAAHQFAEGDVLHWWHPPTSKGIRTRFSDDLLWLPYITMFYVRATGDTGILDDEIGYRAAPLLQPGEDEIFVVPGDAGESGSLYDHCCRALDRSLTEGAHGLPLMGVGDWNDGMNRVGREGRGESVWLGFFLYDILGDFIPVSEARGDTARAATYTAYRAHLADALNDAGWDGGWYRRAFYDNGLPLGSADSDECRIDALAQAWAVLSGAAPSDRADMALDALEEHLISEDDGMIRLLAPPFDRTANDPGYIKGYLPGVRENGGQYTHGVLWAVRALAEAGRTERAARLLEMLTPVVRGGSPEHAARYRVEPYVVAADVYGVQPHVGRGGWTWYTGSAGWMYRIALESILGLSLHDGREIHLQPCIPGEWPGFSVRYRLPDGTTYIIEVERSDAAVAAWLDGNALDVSHGVAIPIVRDGGTHAVRVMWPR
jgi:N,N'-diacetylchitobiose phosphorylase